jgi:hypothetical protein
MSSTEYASLSVGVRPKQNIPENLKDEEWAKRNVDWCVSMSPIFVNPPEADLYDRYNGVRSEEAFNHITNTFGIEFPAGKLKHIPLARPLLNVLQGEVEERPLNFIVRAEDTDAVNQKLEQISTQLLDTMVQLIRSGQPLDVQIDQIEKYYKTDFQTELEIGTHHALNAYINKHHLERKFFDCFRDKTITGREYYRVRINRIGEDPIFESIRPGHLYYPWDNKEWVKECDWCVYPMQMTPVQILDSFGEKLEPDDRNRLEDMIDMYSRDSYKLRGADEADRMLNNADDYRDYMSHFTNKITVYFTEWKSIRKVYFIQNPNKYVPGADFVKFIQEDKLEELNGAKRKNLQVRYVQDLWQGVRIGDTIHVDLGKVKYPVRSLSEPSKVYLTFNGPTYNGRVKPYSLVKQTNDLQDLYDVLHYHKENLIAMSGTKGSYMDLSQLPHFGDPEAEGDSQFTHNLKMFLYYKKLGVAFIDRAKESADKSFNQFGTYDDTVGQGLNVVLSMIQHIEEIAGRLIGVNRQRLGAIANREGKGTTEHAIMQSNLVTEAIFNEHDEFVRHALEDILNACRITWKNGYTGIYTSDQYTQNIFTLDPSFALSDFGIYITNRFSDARSIGEIKEFAYQMVGKSLLEFEDILPLFRKSNLKDVEKTISKNLETRKKAINEQQQQAAALEMQMRNAREQSEIQKIQAEIQKILSDIQLNQKMAEIEESTLSLKEKELTQDQQNESEHLALEAKQLDVASAQKVSSSTEVKNKK